MTSESGEAELSQFALHGASRVLDRFWNGPGNSWTPVDVLRCDFQNQSNKFNYLDQNPFFYH
jgi:hypothetical protein